MHEPEFDVFTWETNITLEACIYILRFKNFAHICPSTMLCNHL